MAPKPAPEARDLTTASQGKGHLCNAPFTLRQGSFGFDPVPQLSWAGLLLAASSEHSGIARPQSGRLRPLPVCLPARLAYTPGFSEKLGYSHAHLSRDSHRKPEQ